MRRSAPWAGCGRSRSRSLVGIALFVVLLSVPGAPQHASLEAAGALADTLADRGLVAELVSAVLDGAVITVFTWLAEASESDLTRVVIALAVGFVLLAPSMNHSVVGFGEILAGRVERGARAQPHRPCAPARWPAVSLRMPAASSSASAACTS